MIMKSKASIKPLTLSAVLENEHYRKGDITTGLSLQNLLMGFSHQFRQAISGQPITTALSAVWG